MKYFKTIYAVRLFFAVLFLNSTLMAQESGYFPLVGDWPYGTCNDVHVVENIAYMGNGNYFQIYNVSDKLNPALLGEVKLTGIVHQIVIHNNLAFVAIKEEDEDDQDLQIVDISDPANPVLLGLHERQFSSIVSILPVHNYIYLLMSGYFEVIDVSDPANPIKIENAFFDSGIKQGTLRDNLVYAANSRTGLQIFDISDPANIFKVSELALGDTTQLDPYSIEIRDNYAFLGVRGTGLVIVDISDPANPVEVASIPPSTLGYDSHIALNGNHLYFADASYGNIYIYDVSDVENPQERYKSERGANIKSLGISENFLYVARDYNSAIYNSGLQILSIENPVNSTLAAVITTPGAPASLKVFEEKNEAFVIAHNIYVLDITDKNNPKTKAVIQTGSQIIDFSIVDNYLFAAMSKDGFGIFDITDPEAPQQIGHYNTAQFGSGQFIGDARGVSIKDNYAFVAISYAGLIVLEISDKTKPQLVAHLTEHGGHGMERYGDYLYVSKFVYGRYIVDISDPSNSRIIADPEEFDIPGGLFVRDNFAYIADTTLHVFDVSDKSNPVAISSTATDARGNIFVLDNTAYIASRDKDSVFIYDVTNPHSPVPVDSVKLNIDGPAIVTEDYIYTIARHAGVKIYKNEIVPTVVENRESTPFSLSLSQNYPNPFNPSTTIQFEVPADGHVELAVFNMLGQQVAVLADRQFEAGSHRLQFDAAHLPNGVYIYRLRSNGENQFKKMILMK
jgi:hypothetical protein